MPNDLYDEKLEEIRYVPNAEVERPAFEKRVDGRDLVRKTVGTEKLATTIGTADIASNAVTNIKMADDAIKQAELDTEIVTLAFGSGDTSKTATVTASSIVIGFYASTVTGNPASGAAFLQLSVSGTTLTGTLSAAPGGATAVTYTVILLKI